jgi:hypothetical protein
MKTMEELILDRLIEEATRPFKLALEQATKDLTTAKQSLQYRDSALARETEWRQKLQKEAREAEGPLSDLYKAAEKVRLATHGKIPDQLRDAISRLGTAMVVAQKYMDAIPF